MFSQQATMIANFPTTKATRSAGLEVPVFAIPRDGDLGCGDTQVVHNHLGASRCKHQSVDPAEACRRSSKMEEL